MRTIIFSIACAHLFVWTVVFRTYYVVWEDLPYPWPFEVAALACAAVQAGYLVVLTRLLQRS